MFEKKFLSDRSIIDCLKTHCGIAVTTLTSLPLGADANSSVYKAEVQDQSSYFIKLKRGHHHDISIATIELLHNAGIQHIISPIRTIHGQQTQRIDDCTIIVYPFIEGQDGFSRTLTNEQWLILGKTLRQVHEIDVPPPIKQRIRKETYSSKWREAVRSFYNSIETASTNDEIGLNFVEFMKENQAIIHQLVNRAEQLAEKLQTESPKFVLCHSDIHGGNVLLSKANAIYIVDWDEPILAPKERDLMFIGGGVGNVWNKPQEEEAFYDGYGKTEVNKVILSYYRNERIVEDIALFAEELLLPKAGDENRAELYKLFIAMFEPKGVVDIAFKTDKGIK